MHLRARPVAALEHLVAGRGVPGSFASSLRRAALPSATVVESVRCNPLASSSSRACWITSAARTTQRREDAQRRARRDHVPELVKGQVAGRDRLRVVRDPFSRRIVDLSAS
jgi:hypothetical protein